MNELLVTAGIQVISQAAKRLVIKLSSAVGWTATQKTDEELARETYIDEIKNSNLPSLQKAAFISKATEIIKEYTNQHDIVKIAIENMDANARPEEVQDDWLSAFMDKARLISDKEFQVIWGYLLAKECATPNSIPKSLLHILEQMDKEDAKAFSSICKFSVQIHEPDKVVVLPIILYSKVEELYAKYGITFESLSDLQSFGLIQLDTGRFSLTAPDRAYVYTCIKSPMILHYFDEEYTYPDDIKAFPTGNVMFTKSGEALSKIITKVITVEKQADFFKTYCIPFFEKNIEDSQNEKKQGLR